MVKKTKKRKKLAEKRRNLRQMHTKPSVSLPEIPDKPEEKPREQPEKIQESYTEPLIKERNLVLRDLRKTLIMSFVVLGVQFALFWYLR